MNSAIVIPAIIGAVLLVAGVLVFVYGRKK